MNCPDCGYESPFTNFEVYSRSNPCVACGFDMDEAEFYDEATASCVLVEPLVEE